MTNGDSRHYKVQARIDGKWFDNEYVFQTKEEAVAYGESIVAQGSADKCRSIATSEPVKLPPEEKEEED